MKNCYFHQLSLRRNHQNDLNFVLGPDRKVSELKVGVVVLFPLHNLISHPGTKHSQSWMPYRSFFAMVTTYIYIYGYPMSVIRSNNPRLTFKYCAIYNPCISVDVPYRSLGYTWSYYPWQFLG
jgi:hypothetical protein